MSLSSDDDLNSGAVAVGELDLLLTVGGNGKSRHAHVRLAGSNGGDDRIERHVLDLKLHAELIGYCLSDLNVDTNHVFALVVLIGREGGVGRHNESFLFVAVVAAGASAQCEHTNKCKDKCNNLFHLNLPHSKQLNNFKIHNSAC